MPKVYIPVEYLKVLKSYSKGHCEYCKIPEAYSTVPFETEHIIPLFLNGKTILENLARACRSCNSAKGIKIFGLDPISGKEVSLFHPRIQSWSEHFKWNEDFTLIIGMTPIGHATIKCLKMNKPEHINLRKLLVQFQKHPPEDSYGEI